MENVQEKFIYTGTKSSSKTYNKSVLSIDRLKYIIQQKFSYFDEGSRVIAFLSADEQFVLKLFKNPIGINNQFKKWGINLGTVAWSPSVGNSKRSAEILFQRSLKSCKLAFSDLKDETGLIYLHLVKTNSFDLNLNIDGLALNPNSTAFVIQKKAKLIGNILTELMEQGEISKAKVVIDMLINLIIQIWKKGFTEDTYNFHNNYGIDNNGKMLLLDTGELYKSRSKVKEQIKAKNILRKESFDFLQNNFPALAEYLTIQVDSKFAKLPTELLY